jgi:hypothetical protein
MNRELWDSDWVLGQFWDSFRQESEAGEGRIAENAVQLRIFRVGA